MGAGIKALKSIPKGSTVIKMNTRLGLSSNFFELTESKEDTKEDIEF